MLKNNEMITFPWGPGGDTFQFSLPEDWRIKTILEPNHPDNLPASEEELDRALANPIGSDPLKQFAKRGKTALIVIDDRTRPTPVDKLLPRVVEELNQAGVTDSNITIIVALGTHRSMTDEEIVERIGADMRARLKVVQHDCFDKKNNVPMGKTPTHGVSVSFNRLAVESDTIVSISCIEAHEIAGFGGGYKNLMPGLAGTEAIYATHNARFVRPERISNSGMPRERNRFRIMIDECGALLGPKVFIVNTVLDPVNIVAIVAGDPLEAHAEGRRIVSSFSSVKLDSLADVVIANARPLDIDLRTSFKACLNAATALKPGGLFISTSAAPDAIGDMRLPSSLPKIAKEFIRLVPLRFLEQIIPLVNKHPDQAVGTISALSILKKADAWLYYTPVTEGIGPLRSVGIEFFNDMDKLWKRAKQIRPQAEVVLLPQAGASFIAWD